jgi:hypothetical protein
VNLPKVDSEDEIALQFLSGFALLVVGAWLVAPALALLLAGGLITFSAIRRSS